PSLLQQSGAYASFPSSPVTGDVYRSEMHGWRYSGSAWVPFGPLFPLADPNLQTFAWVNQGAATVSNTYGGIFVSCATNSGSHGIRIRKKAAPATPYTITAYVLPAFVL